jgi:GNAT superfamily N-acetyltransferase
MYTISTDRERLDLDRIYRWLSEESYWAQERTREVVERSIEPSLAFGAYLGSEQVGFARIVTDSSTFAWLCDVFVDTKHRRRGVGKLLVKAATEHPELRGLRLMRLATRCPSTLRNVRRLPRSADSGTLDGSPRQAWGNALRELGPSLKERAKKKAPRCVGQPK